MATLHTPYGKIWTAVASKCGIVDCPRCHATYEVSTDEMITATIARMTCEADDCGITFNVYAEDSDGE